MGAGTEERKEGLGEAKSIMVEKWHFTFVQISRMHSTNREPNYGRRVVMMCEWSSSVVTNVRPLMVGEAVHV